MKPSDEFWMLLGVAAISLAVAVGIALIVWADGMYQS